MQKSRVSNPGSTRAHTLQKGIDRLVSLLEAENAAMRETTFLRADVTDSGVKSGLNHLLSTKEMISPKVANPYAPFFEDVWVGYEKLATHDDWVVIGFEPAGESAILDGPVTRHAPRLFVHPVFPTGGTSRWVTLETRIYKLPATPEAKLSLGLVANFKFDDPQQTMHTNTIKVALRRTQKDGTWSDSDLGFFPVTTVPMAHSLIAKVEALDSPLEEAEARASLIFWLPVHGSYVFNLFGFSMGVG